MSAKRDRIKGTEESWNNIKKRKRNISYSASFSSSINIILFQPLLAIPHFTHINYGIIRIMKNIKIHQSKMKEELGKNKEEREEKGSGHPTLLTRGSDLNRSGFSRNIFLSLLLLQRKEYIGIPFMNGSGGRRILI